jgi:hypothetical protein
MQETRDIIEHRIPDTRISTPLAIASGDYVPECHPLTSQLNSPGAVREVMIDPEECYDNPPEVVFFHSRNTPASGGTEGQENYRV